MTLLMVYGESVPTELADAIDLTGYAWKAIGSVESAERLAPADGWAGAVVMADDIERAVDFCRAMRGGDKRLAPILLAIPAKSVEQIEVVDDIFDDFITLPLRAGELQARLRRAMWAAHGGTRPELIEYGGLVLNLATYQATVAGRPLDMTYMEYELLKFLATNAERAYSRQELLRQVWGYEYYGGARTVDVHVRRLRAKLGEEHAALIQTVRSVGYIFGRSRWND